MEAHTHTPPVTQTCYHCGEDCGKEPILAYAHAFCCQGCKMVYEILQEKGMCQYYAIENAPGANRKKTARENAFAFLDDEKIKSALIRFADNNQSHVVFYLPQIHCSSCLWLLENLHRVNPAVISSKVWFEKKEVELVFDHHAISLRQLAELLTSVGYEPYISNSDLNRQPKKENKTRLYRLGVAGFCFANIMLMSFPEYLGIDSKEVMLQTLFRYANLVLSLPVFFYSAAEFYNSAWKSLKHRFLNIDAPIVLAVWVTFIRSLYEVFSGTGSGYFDSMSGIVFFMLAGRVLQDKTYRQLSFERDYTSYFPVAVTRLVHGSPESVMLSDIRLNDTLLIHHEELIPADGIITRGHALIDYSFVSGESLPVRREMGEIIYAGGKQISGTLELLVIREVSQSYLTRLWNKTEDRKQPDEERSFVHLLSRYFTWIVFSIALLAAAYWYFYNPAMVWRSVTAILIVACPCALLLSNTFTNASILRWLGRNHFYLRNAQVIEDMADADCIVFDKTGTLTTSRYQEIQYEGETLTTHQKQAIGALAAQSLHPLSRAIAEWAGVQAGGQVKAYREYPGRGIEGIVGDELVSLGSESFIHERTPGSTDNNSVVWVSAEEKILGKFRFRNHYREHLKPLMLALKPKYRLAVLSGDNAGEKERLQQLLGFETILLFNQQPEDKLNAIRLLQQQGRKVIMIGDGLNDAGALQQADVGIAVSDNSNYFTPASDAILSADSLYRLATFIKVCKANRRIVMSAFAVSILYNIAGLYFAVNGVLSPLIAALLMPSSSISILLMTFGISNLYARKIRLPEPLKQNMTKLI